MAVVFDAVSNIATQNDVTIFSWSHTTGSGADRVLIVGVAVDKGGGTLRTVTGVTYGGVAMTSVGTVDDTFIRSDLWRLVNPASGANTVEVTLSGSSVFASGGAVSVTGAHQTTPTGTFASNTGSGSGPTVDVVSAVDELVIDTVVSDDEVTVGAGQTLRWETTGNCIAHCSTEPGAASVTMSWVNNTFWVTAAVSIKAAAAAVIKGRVLMAPYIPA